ncbi:MAG TPA: L-ribulose-5-phosphate 3-epimerase [Rectinemataceae bacterium]|nr:L-ribulose-5-phosphate 3-epimerase [Rectinemataceae bacterium]
MIETRAPVFGIYEKALPPHDDWNRILASAAEAGYSYVEMSIDESDGRLGRLDWSPRQRGELRAAVDSTRIPVRSICLSGHRRFPFGSAEPRVRERARDIMRKALDLAVDVGVRTIQLAGYDVYYEPSTGDSLSRFREALHWAVGLAEEAQVMLAMEIMDTPLMGTISRWLEYARAIPSPWFQVYPDIGNLSAWSSSVSEELGKAAGRIVAVHLKDTLRPRADFAGQFKELPFGKGEVDFVAAFRTLARLGFRGCFLVEMWTHSAPDPVAECRAAREWLLGKMAEGGCL